jgi:predicted dehydrogenase
LIDSGEYGDVQSIYAKIAVPAGTLAADDIRFNYGLAGGACLDLAYVFSAACYFANTTQDTAVEAISATPRICKTDSKIDEAMNATFALTSPGKPRITCTVDADLALGNFFWRIPKFWAIAPTVTVELEKAKIHFDNFAGAWFKHSITVSEKDQHGKLSGKKRVVKCYKGGPQWGDTGGNWWTTYRYQLEAFCNRVKAVEGAPNDDSRSDALGPWLSLEQSAKMMSVIDAIYEKAGLPKRGLTGQ